MFAEVIIPLALPRNYTWSVPERFREQVRPGVRVEVVLGKNKKYAGVIRTLHDEMPQAFEPKEILNVLDVEPIVYPQQLQLWHWIAQYYMCSEGEVMAAALPSHFKLSSETTIVFNEEYGEDFMQLDHDEFLVAEALLIKKELKVPEVQQVLDSSHVYPVIKRLIEKKVCSVWEALKETYAPKKETFVMLNTAYDNEDALADLLNEDKKLQRAEKQMELLLSYLHLQKTQGEVTKSELLKKSGASDAQLKGLVDKNILWLEKRQIDRLLYLPRDIKIDFSLTPAQEEAYEKVKQSFEQKPVTLLHGVTASGKTQVYIRLIENAIRQGKQVLYLLPEIALTSQIIRRLQKHFGGYIGIYHSKFNQNERIEIWNKVKTGELKVVLGARSSIFLPFTDLGLIVIDEEHDPSFKQQEPAPRYNARDAAIYYASLFKAKVLLGSATPSVESYYNAQQQKYGFVELAERFGGVKMPTIELVDIKKIPKLNKEKVILTPDLKAAIQRSLDAGKQVILFQNRRGYSPYQVCQTCGWIPHCKFCDVSLNFHKNTNKLHCHYCGTVYPIVYTCQACGNHHFLQQNFGTEKIEEHVEEQLPGVKVARMDVDSVRGKTAHDNLIQQFEQQRIQVLVGTQMVVKGLDFENVNLVGVLDADSLLSFADFRVNERAFQLMEQVSGRAGRKDGEGHVMIQVAQMAHPVLHYVQQHNYPAFFNTEIEARRQFFYPPFSRIILLTFRNKSKELVDGAARQLAEYLKPQYGQYMIGPAEPVVNRIRNQYLMELMFKLPKDSALIQQCKQQIQDQIAVLHYDKRFRSVVIIPDVDTQ
ncbi:replication restart helicase PriA [Pseudobacter ginsenosidimutans]|uniref:Replication restart protein PriA n=1 Tax=Pseudobacter ginsenosidimutans TaxID=661488 RepID=A0A4Q7N139_9BACT|nr:primosomal protein N' [Pseudobacter ginsenosidimutans]RZS75341.1 replication restart DNA helicase PriA [Pseudobacter ginsenosidimutans]